MPALHLVPQESALDMYFALEGQRNQLEADAEQLLGQVQQQAVALRWARASSWLATSARLTERWQTQAVLLGGCSSAPMLFDVGRLICRCSPPWTLQPTAAGGGRAAAGSGGGGAWRPGHAGQPL